jgi:hypothetical protein
VQESRVLGILKKLQNLASKALTLKLLFDSWCLEILDFNGYRKAPGRRQELREVFQKATRGFQKVPTKPLSRLSRKFPEGHQKLPRSFREAQARVKGFYS